MTLIRVIEEFYNTDESLHREYILSMKARDILEVLEDLDLNEDDYPDEIYDSYNLTILQVQKLRPFLEIDFEPNETLYSYQLGCYQE